MREAESERSSAIAQWWEAVRTSAPSDLGGLWFGLVELGRPVPGWHLYVAGTETSDPDDETGDWAAPDYVWWPEGRYFAVPELES